MEDSKRGTKIALSEETRDEAERRRAKDKAGKLLRAVGMELPPKFLESLPRRRHW